MYRHCYVLHVFPNAWLIRCCFCDGEWEELATTDILVAVTCPHCDEMQGVNYPNGVAYGGPVVEETTLTLVRRDTGPRPFDNTPRWIKGLFAGFPA